MLGLRRLRLALPSRQMRQFSSFLDKVPPRWDWKVTRETSGYVDVKDLNIPPGVELLEDDGTPKTKVWVEIPRFEKDDGTVHTGGRELADFWTRKNTYPEREWKEGDQMWWCNKVEGEPLLVQYSTFGVGDRNAALMFFGVIAVFYILFRLCEYVPQVERVELEVFREEEDSPTPTKPIRWVVFETPSEVKAKEMKQLAAHAGSQ